MKRLVASKIMVSTLQPEPMGMHTQTNQSDSHSFSCPRQTSGAKPGTFIRSGFTLIEVLIGTVLLSTLVVSGIHGLRLHQRQLRFNEHRMEAVPIAERLLTLWSNQPSGVPVGTSGVIDAQRQWLWRTQLVGVQSVFGQQVLVVRFEVVEDLPTPGTVLVSVDLLKPAPAAALPALGPETMSPTDESETPQPVMNEP